MTMSRRAFMERAVVAGTMIAATGGTAYAKSDPSSTKGPNMTAPVQGKSILLQDITVGATGKNADVLIADGKIAKIGTNLQQADAEKIACMGCLLLPSFIDAHVHLDKTRIGAPQRLHHQATATVAQRAANERQLRVDLKHDPYKFGSNLVHQMAAMGTTHIRSHIDIDPLTKLSGVEALMRIREDFKGYMDIEFVAFPQSGIVKAEGVADLMAQALDMGVEYIGGLDPEVFDNDRKGHLDVLFALAEKTGKPIDIHLHEPGQVGLATIKDIIARGKALGMKDKITISHGFALGQISQDELKALLPEMVDMGVRVIGSAPGHVTFPPVDALLDAGILYAGANDNIQDMWSPWGNGDMLQRAMFLAYKNNYRADEPLMRPFEMVTNIPAQHIGLKNHGLEYLKEGAIANLVVVEATDVPAAVLYVPERKLVLKNGVVTGRDGKSTIPKKA
ncbi:amidohydrolase [Microvirga sp. W0021]|uniref:Amidohydrolase n=1 Tax=Hohaiivirga grylli TaxID=3133970 RepID=A0ABV0BGU5_9HYPH